MAEMFRKIAGALMNDQCFNKFFLDYNFFDGPCLTAVLSKVLGYSIVAGALLVKLPQILKIISAGSGKGVSFTSLLLEIYAVMSMFAYSIARNFPFSTWGDSFFLLLQNLMIGALIQFFNKKPNAAIGFVVIFAAAFVVLLSGLTPLSVLSALQASNMPAVVIGKLIQALDNYKNGHTGQLSAITLTLLFLGSLARIFTSIQETGDSLVIANYVVSSIANGTILAQIVYYWNAQAEPKPKKE